MFTFLLPFIHLFIQHYFASSLLATVCKIEEERGLVSEKDNGPEGLETPTSCKGVREGERGCEGGGGREGGGC